MIKILKLTSTSKKYLEYFYQEHSHIQQLSYTDHVAEMEWDAYAENGFWKINLAKFPQYQFKEYYIDQEQLQKKWAKENRIAFGKQWEKVILEAQIEEFQPEIIFEDEDFLFTPSFRKALHKKFPFIKHFIAWDGYIKSDMDRFEGCDLILTCVQTIVNRYQERGMKSFLLPFGFEGSLLSRIQPGNSSYDLSFVGNIIPNIHGGRLSTLDQLSKSLDLDFWLSNLSSKISHFKRRLNYYRQGPPAVWKIIRNFEKANHGKAYGLKMYTIFSQSKMTLNIHGDQVAEAGNLRLIEATGSGTCLVTDYKPNIAQYFEEDKEIVTFRSAGEAIEKITFLLNNDQQRQAIAQASQRKVLKDFSFFERVKRFDDILMQHLF
ncbi:MAG: glycosyltransferase family protein [Chitinophagaceae bacterium]